MKDLYKIADIVEDILKNDETARGNDNYLYFKVCAMMDSSVLNQQFGDVLLSFNGYDLPKYESVGRARRKIQAEKPELRPVLEVERARYERAIDYQKFSRKEVR